MVARALLAFVFASLLRADAPPPLVIGAFDDDYGGHHVVTAGEWQQGRDPARADRYRIVQWNTAKRYLIAQNAAGNRSAPTKWTRIDWAPLDAMAPWTWAFCFSAYDASSEAAAEAASVDHAALKTGCNGYPFSRMKRTTP